MIRQVVRVLCLALPLMAATAGDLQAQGQAQPQAQDQTRATASHEALRQGRTYTQWLYAGQVDRLWPHFGPNLKSHFVDRKGLQAFAAKIESELGRETELVAERTLPWFGNTIYNRTAKFSHFAKPVWIRWRVTPTGRIEGFLVTPVPATAPSRYLDYRTKTSLRLPFEGKWFVLWGGRSMFDNYHAVSVAQRFADDFVVVRDGSTHSGSPTSNSSYYCFGKPVLAPAGGAVVAAEDGIADNAPGHMNDKQPLGNHVIIDHGNGEYSFLAHLQRGSVQVRPGMPVKAGDRLGRCGNSGNSSEPHLHYHLQTTPRFEYGEALPAQFLDYRADGREVSRGEPVRGQTVERQ